MSDIIATQRRNHFHIFTTAHAFSSKIFMIFKVIHAIEIFYLFLSVWVLKNNQMKTLDIKHVFPSWSIDKTTKDFKTRFTFFLNILLFFWILVKMTVNQVLYPFYKFYKSTIEELLWHDVLQRYFITPQGEKTFPLNM